MKLSKTVQESYRMAVQALSRSYAPYSHLHVASAIKWKGVDEIFCGVNVENASYGATICAERSAICSTVSQVGKKELEFVVVISDFKDGPIPPCGMCLQVMAEFAQEDIPVYLGDSKSLKEESKLSELMPFRFKSDMLPQT